MINYKIQALKHLKHGYYINIWMGYIIVIKL